MTKPVVAVRTIAWAAALAVAAGGMAGFAQSQDGVIRSDAADALPPPETWRCDRIAAEYDAWLEAGNSPQSWRYAGLTYRRVSDERRYNWDDWLAWHRDACSAGARGGSLPATGPLIGGIVGALGVTALAAGSGGGSGGADSPG